MLDGSPKPKMQGRSRKLHAKLTTLIGMLAAMRKRQNPTLAKKDIERDLQAYVRKILVGNVDDVFYDNLLDHMIAYKENRIEVFLKHLPTKWAYVLESLAETSEKPLD